MSSVLQESEAPADQFQAYVTLPDGAAAQIQAPSLSVLAEIMSRLRPVASVTRKSSTAGKPSAGAVTDPAGAPASQITESSAQPVAGAAAGEAGNASASTGTQASAQPAASGSAASVGDVRPMTPEELLKAVGERVNVLAKKSRDTALGELKKFGVARGGELTDAQKAEFLTNTASLVA